jgi:non-ribosomal peptide synthetase component F
MQDCRNCLSLLAAAGIGTSEHAATPRSQETNGRMTKTTASDLKARLAQLPPEQRALLQQRLARKSGRPAATQAIAPRLASDPRVLSFAQQRLWFLEQLRPGTATYNVPFFCRIEGDLNEEALKRAVEAVVARHEVLRTVFLNANGRPLTATPRHWQVPFRAIDLCGKAEEADALVQQEAARPFNLGRDVMLRALLLRLGEREHLFLHTSHHIAWDVKSKELFYQEWTHNYEAFAAGRSPELPVLPVQYADYALWQRRWLEGDSLRQLQEYWKRQLSGAPPCLDFPTARPRPPAQSFRGAKLPVRLPAQLFSAVSALSLKSGATPFMTLLATFKVFLYCCTGRHDLCVGSPVLGRDQVETENLIGFFINTVVLRTQLSPTMSLRQLIARTRECTLGAVSNQALPFDKVVEVIRPPRDLSRMPLFQVNFRLQGPPPAPLNVGGLVVSPPEFVDSGNAKFDLSLELPGNEHGCGFWEYSTDLFEEAVVRKFAEGFEALLGELVAHPDMPLDEVPAVRALRCGLQPVAFDTSGNSPSHSIQRNGRAKLVPRQRPRPTHSDQCTARPDIPVQAIARRSDADPRVVSFAQQRLWFLDQLRPGTAAYNVPFYCRIEGDLDADALRRSVEAVVARHEVLRTVFLTAKGRPIAAMPRSWKVPFREVDLRGRADEADALVHQEAARPFNLARDVMLRALLVRLNEREHLFLHVSHHIAWEYWSTSIFYQELGALYEAFAGGRVPALPDLPIQYGDYAHWQRRCLEGATLRRLEDYWKRQLSNAPPRLELPTDYPRPPVHTLRGAKLPSNLPPALLESARALSLKSGVTPFMTLLAAFKVLLFCHCGQRDLCVGSPVAIRPRTETKNLIGFFANTVVLRSQLAEDLSFRAFMGRVRDTTLGAIANQALPFDKIVEAVSPPRDLSRMPLFQVNFRMLKQPPEPLKLAGLQVDPSEYIDSGTSKFDLALELVANPGTRGYGSTGFWEYCSDLFAEATIRRMAGDYERILAGLIERPDEPLGTVPAVREVRDRRRLDTPEN